ncbi:hypothetical protein H8E50_04940 [bacterium]|nr:hypothetical protein [bacterium]
MLILSTASGNITNALSWHDHTHISVAKAAGYSSWYNAAGPDIAKIKAGDIEGKNHYFNNPEDLSITAEMVLAQAENYNDPKDSAGHLYGAIIASVKKYRIQKKTGKYAEYHMAYAAHYIGDLSQPLHNMPFDTFNKTRHSANDGTVEETVLNSIEILQNHMYEIRLDIREFDRSLAEEIAQIANSARILGVKLKKEQRNMTSQEAYTQLGRSASLLRAVLVSLGKYTDRKNN